MGRGIRLSNVARLGEQERSAVFTLVAAATQLDGVAPLSEQVLLAIRGGPPVRPPASRPHFLTYDGTDLAGYAHLETGLAGEALTAEAVVDPAYRRHGIGTALLRALEKATKSGAQDRPQGPSPRSPQPEAPALRLWSHGHLDGARAFALRDGYSIERELWQMRRSLGTESPPLPHVNLPEGFRARRFVVGRDEDAWLRVNARAFADHPEQGRITREDLDLRIAEPWFDAHGFFLIEDARGIEDGPGFEDTRSLIPLLAASHWTKVVPGQDPQVRPSEGEVYVVGVDPAYQGLGLGRAVTVLGLAHLQEQGLSQAMLYVDADNPAAVATYSRLGFSRSAVDVMYSHAVHPQVGR